MTSDPPVLVADATRARAELGWRPTRTSLEMQVRDAWGWQCVHLAKGKIRV